MGFFDSLQEGLSTAGGWLMDNSDSILKVATTVIGIIAVETGEEVKLEDTANQLPVIQQGLARNAQILLQQMNEKLPITAGQGADGTETLWGDCTGVWPDPSLSGGYARQDIVSDVSKFMAANGIPSVVSSSTGEVDLASNLAATIMENSTGSAAGKGNPGINWTPFSYKDTKTGVSVTGMHGLYAIPLGMDGSKHAWHSFIRLGFNLTAEAKAAHEERKKLHALVRLSAAPAPPYNTTTIAVAWGSGAGTAGIMKTALETVQKAPLSWYVESEVTDHYISYNYTVFTDTKTPPGSVKQGFTDAISSAIKERGTPEVPTPQPTLRITNSSTVIS